MTGPVRESWTSADGQHRILWGDCLEILPTLDTSEVAAVLADPPYGIGDRLVKGGGTGGAYSGMIGSGAEKWDVKPPKEFLDRLLTVGRHQIIWGGNFFELPPCEKPLCWDKIRPNQKNASEWEYAWTSLTGRAEKFDYCGNAGFILKTPRVHPTQKPLPLMEWCLEFLPPGLILDPFAGSCTVAVACARTGRRSISIETEERYFRIGIERMEREAARHPLLEPNPAKQLLFPEPGA